MAEPFSNPSITSLLSFYHALDDITHSYLQDLERFIGFQASSRSQVAGALSEWWDDKLDVFSLTAKIFAVLAEKSALELLHGLNNIFRLRGSLPRLHCSLNNDHDDFIAVVNSDGSRIYLLSQLSSPSLTWMFSTEGLTDDALIGLASRLDQQTARWAIQLLHIELNLRHVEIPARKRCMGILHRLVQTFRVLPPSHFLHNVIQEGQHPVRGGGYADIFKGQLQWTNPSYQSVPVCIKALRIFQIHDTKEREKSLKQFCLEAFLWTHLNHQNILPCFGVSVEVIENRLCLISPWMPNGNIMEFLKLNPLHDRLEAIIGVARGLSYLHGLEPQIVHGDIKGVNILVTKEGRCCLADFGLCLMVETHSVGATATSSAVKGTTRWLAPELLIPLDEKSPKPNKAGRDIYAFACTALEIFTEKPPFFDQKIDAAVILQVLQGKRPTRPSEMQMPWLDNVWEMMKECWIEDSHSRPPAMDLVQRLERISADRPEVSVMPQSPPQSIVNINHSSSHQSDSASWMLRNFDPATDSLSPVSSVAHSDPCEYRLQPDEPPLSEMSPPPVPPIPYSHSSDHTVTFIPPVPSSPLPSHLLGDDRMRPHPITVTVPTIPALLSTMPVVQQPSHDPTLKLVWCRYVLLFVNHSRSSLSDYNTPHPAAMNDAKLSSLAQVAVPMVLQLASQGQNTTPPPPWAAEAMYYRAMLTASGSFPEHVEHNPRRAFRDFETAARAGYHRAWFNLGRDYEHFDDLVHAKDCFERGAKAPPGAGGESCLYRLGIAHLTGQLGVSTDIAKGLKLIRKAAIQSSLETPEPAYVYALLLLDEFSPVSVPITMFATLSLLPNATAHMNLPTRTAHEARKYLELSALFHYGPAQYKLAFCFEHASPESAFPFDPLLSVEWYSKASEGVFGKPGEVEAEIALSKWFLCGAQGVFDKDESLAWTFAERAAKRGLPSAMFALGYYLEVGIGPRGVNIPEAIEWYKKAQFEGNEDAHGRLSALMQSNPQALTRKEHEKITRAKLVRRRLQAKERSTLLQTQTQEDAPGSERSGRRRDGGNRKNIFTEELSQLQQHLPKGGGESTANRPSPRALSHSTTLPPPAYGSEPSSGPNARYKALPALPSRRFTTSSTPSSGSAPDGEGETIPEAREVPAPHRPMTFAEMDIRGVPAEGKECVVM